MPRRVNTYPAEQHTELFTPEDMSDFLLVYSV